MNNFFDDFFSDPVLGVIALCVLGFMGYLVHEAYYEIRRRQRHNAVRNRHH